MRIIKLTLAVIALFGVSAIAKSFKNHVRSSRDHEDLSQSNAACAGGKGGSCPAGQKCNEFGFCIVGGPQPNAACVGGKGGSCPACYKCNEFGFCIADCVFVAPVPNGACAGGKGGSCPAG